jgi:hypothetical protein
LLEPRTCIAGRGVIRPPLGQRPGRNDTIPITNVF